MQTVDGYHYRDATRLTTGLLWLLCLSLIILGAAVISGAAEYSVLTSLRDGMFETDEDAHAAATASDTRQSIVSILQMLFTVTTAVASLRWIHRMNWNARALGAERLDFTPGWSAGWYFVPFMNLWKPYQAMKQIWQASVQPGDWQSQSAPRFLPLWWVLWLAASLLGNGSFRAQMRAEELDQLISANRITLLADVENIPLTIVFLILVHRVSATQARHAAARASEAMVVSAAPATSA